MATWGQLEAEVPELAAFAAERLRRTQAYLATIRSTGAPRVHPVSPIVGGGHLFVFMEPTSPKRRDLHERPAFALHNGVPDSEGTGGEVMVSGTAVETADADLRTVAVEAADYEPADRYVLFELHVDEVRCNAYGDVPLPEPSRWRGRAD